MQILYSYINIKHKENCVIIDKKEEDNLRV
jgi:hypothetical protein